jgi:hypothetical protein
MKENNNRKNNKKKIKKPYKTPIAYTLNLEKLKGIGWYEQWCNGTSQP